jgi:hypothetical protein
VSANNLFGDEPKLQILKVNQGEQNPCVVVIVHDVLPLAVARTRPVARRLYFNIVPSVHGIVSGICGGFTAEDFGNYTLHTLTKCLI